jgi:hypothetical protein
MIFSTNLSEKFLIMRKIGRDIIKNVYLTSCRSQILMKLEFSVQIYEKYSDINFTKLRPVGAELLVDGQIDMKKLMVAFRNIANAAEKYFDDY